MKSQRVASEKVKPCQPSVSCYSNMPTPHPFSSKLLSMFMICTSACSIHALVGDLVQTHSG